MTRFIVSLLGGLTLCFALNAQGQSVDFDRYFTDATLRIDYQFIGTAKTQQIAVSELRKSNHWYGRRCNLDTLLLAGNGQITMRDIATRQTLYTYSFSTLFQEWQNTEEATRLTKSFENVFLLPMPREAVDVEVTLFDSHRRVTAMLTHRVDPADILIRALSDVPRYEVKELLRSGAPSECIDVAIIAEGYTAEEMPAFYAKAQQTCDEIMRYQPFADHKAQFNFYAVGAESDESGISIPGQGLWKQTALGSNFNTFYSDRYLTTLRLTTLHNALSGVPYEHIIILANTDNYGGGGIYNSYEMTAANHRAFNPVVVHEFGHSFAGLADEYAYDDQYEEAYFANVEPWEPNITTLADFSVKWNDMLDKPLRPGEKCREPQGDTPGIIEGAGYQSRGVFRPFHDCRMRTNAHPTFCAVCCRAIERIINYYTVQQH